MRILIVEDEDRTRLGLKKLIGSIDDSFQVIGAAGDGREGKKLIEELKPDVVITDIKMPYMNGIEMIEHFKEVGFPCLFVLLTGHADFEYAQRAIKLHVADYLLKPLTKKDVKDLLNRLKLQLQLTPQKDIPHKTDHAEIDEHEAYESESAVVHYVIDKIRNQYQDYICLESLASDLRLTPEYLSTLLHKELGQTFSSYLKQVRIEKAKELLKHGSLLVSEVAEAVGYSNSRYFCRVFKKETGMTASEFLHSQQS